MAISEGPFQRILDIDGAPRFPCSNLPVMQQEEWWSPVVVPICVQEDFNTPIWESEDQIQTDELGHTIISISTIHLLYSKYWGSRHYEDPNIIWRGFNKDGVTIQDPQIGVSTGPLGLDPALTQGLYGLEFNSVLGGYKYKPSIVSAPTDITATINSLFTSRESDETTSDPNHCGDLVVAEPTGLRYVGYIEFGGSSIFLSTTTFNDPVNSRSNFTRTLPQYDPPPGEDDCDYRVDDIVENYAIPIQGDSLTGDSPPNGNTEILFIDAGFAYLRFGGDLYKTQYDNSSNYGSYSYEYVGKTINGDSVVIGNEGAPSTGFATYDNSELFLNGVKISDQYIDVPTVVDFKSSLGFVSGRQQRTNAFDELFFIDGELCTIKAVTVRLYENAVYVPGGVTDTLVSWLAYDEEFTYTDLSFPGSGVLSFSHNSTGAIGKIAFTYVLLKYTGTVGGVARFDFFNGDYFTSRVGYKVSLDGVPPFMYDYSGKPISVAGPVYPAVFKGGFTGDFFGVYTHGLTGEGLSSSCIGVVEATRVLMCEDEFGQEYSVDFPYPKSERNWGLQASYAGHPDSSSAPTLQHNF